MIDRGARDRLAEALRALASGLISNDEFERRIPTSRDPAVRRVFLDGAWFLYSDLWEYRLKKQHRLAHQTKTEVARWVLFLKTNQPFEWPQPSALERALLLVGGLVTFGLATKLARRKYQSAGDWTVWPFISQRAYEEALKSPVYMNAALQQHVGAAHGESRSLLRRAPLTHIAVIVVGRSTRSLGSFLAAVARLDMPYMI